MYIFHKKAREVHGLFYFSDISNKRPKPQRLGFFMHKKQEPCTASNQEQEQTKNILLIKMIQMFLQVT